MRLKRATGIFAGLSLAAIMTGCVSMPSSRHPLEAQYVMIHYQAMARNNIRYQQNIGEIRRELAAQELETRAQAELPTSLPQLRQYLDHLSAAVEIDVDLALAGFPTISASQRRKILDYYRRPDRGLAFDGSEYNPTWSNELVRIRQEIPRIQDTIHQRMQQARARLGAGDFEAADTLFAEATGLDPGNVDNHAEYDRFQQLWMNTMVETMFKYFEEDVVPALTRFSAVLSDDSSLNDAHIANMHSTINAACSRIVDLRLLAQQRQPFQTALANHYPTLRRIELQVSESRGQTWGGVIGILFRKNDFWRAHETMRSFMAARRIHLDCGNVYLLTEPELEILADILRKRYAELLPLAIEAYNYHANRARIQRLYGLTMTIGRIGLEMMEVANDLAVPKSERLETLGQMLDNAMTMARDRLHEEMTRTIIVPAFESQGAEGPELSRLLHDSLSRKFPAIENTPTPVTVWGVSINPQVTRPNPLGFDYRLSGTIEPINVDTLPVQSIQRSEVEFGRTVSRRSNPDRSMRKEFPTLYSQQVWVYERILNEHAKQATLRATFHLEHAGKRHVSWVDMNTVFGKEHPLDGAAMVDHAEKWERAAIRSTESTRSSDMLTEQDLPLDRAPNLPPDRQIHRAILEHACRTLEEAIVREATAFPLVLMMRTESLPADDKARITANALGTCLEYALLLSSTVPDAGKAGADSWIRARDGMVAHLQRTCSPLWHAISPDADKTMQDIWGLARAAALAYIESERNE